MSQNAKPKFVGVDDGHYAVKVVTEDGKSFTFPSRAKSGKHLINFNGQSGGTDGGIYTTEEGNVFTVSPTLSDPMGTRFADYPRSELLRVLVHHSLRGAGMGGQNVSIATGLPVSHYYIDSAPNEALIAAKQKNLMKAVHADLGELATIKKNIVTTEAIAAYFDQIINMDGSESKRHADFEGATVGVIDIGGRTTDCAVIMPGGTHVDSARSGSNDVGVLNLDSRVDAMLRAKYGYDHVPPSMIEMAVKNGSIKNFGKELDVSQMVIDAKRQLAEEIMGVVRTKIGSGRDLDYILLVGGGSIVMREFLTDHFPNFLIPEDAAFSNARGMYKIARYVYGEA